MKKTIIYFHGYGSSGMSNTVNYLKKQLPDCKVIAPDIPVDPQEALPYLRMLCSVHKPALVIGTSMGAMYAMQMLDCRRICVNPALRMSGQPEVLKVGTGDVPQAFRQTYDEIHSPLKEEFRFRAHNQYLSIAVAFGLVGLAFFLVVLLWPYFSSKKSRTYLYTVFLCIILLSMFPEDTMETQAGASLFAFFEALLLVMREDKMTA